MGVASWIFGSNIDNVIDKGASLIDNAFFTDQEKSVATHKVLDFKLKHAEMTANQSPARRMIALIIVANFTAMLWVGVIAKAWGSDAFSVYVFETMKENVNDPFMIVIGFYFLAHVVKGLKR